MFFLSLIRGGIGIRQGLGVDWLYISQEAGYKQAWQLLSAGGHWPSRGGAEAVFRKVLWVRRSTGFFSEVSLN